MKEPKVTVTVLERWRSQSRPPGAQGPLSRFGDTAANAGTLALLDSYDATRGLNVGVKTLAASAAAGLFRIALMPVDACKTILQACARPPPDIMKCLLLCGCHTIHQRVFTVHRAAPLCQASRKHTLSPA